jgi:NAD-dependent SIR2 family protein deacetylase
MLTMTPNDPTRPEYRTIDPYADDVVDLGDDLAGSKTRLECSKCRPGSTRPVRYRDDPKSVVRCASCGKKHSRDSLTVV